jgi:hypothetical protein
MDQGRIATSSPQEDEFAALLLGEPSVYRAFIDPRRFDECAGELWSGRDAQDQNALVRWQAFLRGLNSSPAGKPLLIKSPTHTFRLPFLRQLFPNAKFIWLARQVGELLPSNLRMWRSMLDIYGMWSSPEGALERFLDKMIVAASDVLSQCLDEMPREKMLCIDFEALRTNRIATLKRVVRFLALDRSDEVDIAAERLEMIVGHIPTYQGRGTAMQVDARGKRLEALVASARRRFA